jgi:hypothetical protein
MAVRPFRRRWRDRQARETELAIDVATLDRTNETAVTRDVAVDTEKIADRLNRLEVMPPETETTAARRLDDIMIAEPVKRPQP